MYQHRAFFNSSFIAKKRKKIINLSLAFTVSAIALTSYLNISILWLYATTNQLEGMMPQNHTLWSYIRYSAEGDHLMVQSDDQWSDIKLAVYMTTHLPESHILYLPCWNDAIQRMKIFRNADLILYTTAEPKPEQLALLPFKNRIIKLYSNTGYQGGAIQAMIDPFVENKTWFDKYDWIIRVNPDVLIRDDTWLIETMINTSCDGIFHECHNKHDYSNPYPYLHSDFYAFRPSALVREEVLQAINNDTAEGQTTSIFRNIYDSGRFAFVKGAINSQGGMCRIEGVNSPVIHVHERHTSCPYYYNITQENVY